MRKIYLSLLVLSVGTSAMAQDAADKKIQAGLAAGFGVNFPKMGTKYMVRDGVGTDLTIGMNLNYNFSPNIGFATGIEFDFESMKFKPNTANPTYYRYSDTEIIQQGDTQGGENVFHLTDRQQKPVYISIPTMLIFKTNYIGYFRYFGKFGMRHSILLGNKMNDNGFNVLAPLGAETAAENNNMRASSSMNLYKGAVGLAGGAEWNFSGNTCLVVELGYYYGISPVINVTNTKNQTLYTNNPNDGGDADAYYTNKVSQSQLMLKVSILF